MAVKNIFTPVIVYTNGVLISSDKVNPNVLTKAIRQFYVNFGRKYADSRTAMVMRGETIIIEGEQVADGYLNHTVVYIGDDADSLPPPKAPNGYPKLLDGGKPA